MENFSIKELKEYVKTDMPIEDWLSFLNDEEIQKKINDGRKMLGKRTIKFASNFTPPTYNDVFIYMTNYGAKMGLKMNEKSLAAKFFDRQLQIGWKVKAGNNLFPMADWEAAVRTFLRNEHAYGNGTVIKKE